MVTKYYMGSDEEGNGAVGLFYGIHGMIYPDISGMVSYQGSYMT
jgi:hypothetical protein